ncbi:MAG: hypothetical protein NC336_00875 [Clostridium sp.]|nr:hypothetical protein [Clostridium sp.]
MPAAGNVDEQKRREYERDARMFKKAMEKLVIRPSRIVIEPDPCSAGGVGIAVSGVGHYTRPWCASV